MTKTLVERLRGRAHSFRRIMGNQGYYGAGDARIDDEAADRIEKLERENQDAIEAAFAYKARIEKLEAALDAAHCWIDASVFELEEAGVHRDDVLTYARELRNIAGYSGKPKNDTLSSVNAAALEEKQ